MGYRQQELVSYIDRVVKGIYKVIVKRKKMKVCSLGIFIYQMNLEQLDNLCYSLEMLNKTVERGCNECSSLKTHQSYRNKHTSRDIDYQRHTFCVKFLICDEACIDFLYSFGGFSCNSCGLTKILALRSDECSFWYYSKTFPFFVSQFDEIQALTKDSGVSAVRPNFVFEVNYSEANNAKFQDVRKGRELLYAYHGSRLENFHSILHHGLASHMNKVKRCITSTLALLQ